MPIEPVPVRDDSWKSLIGSVTYPGDILSPVGEEWDAEKDAPEPN